MPLYAGDEPSIAPRLEAVKCAVPELLIIDKMSPIGIQVTSVELIDLWRDP